MPTNESRVAPDSKEKRTLAWNENWAMKEALAANGIVIHEIDATSLNQVKQLVENNKTDEGFKQMSDIILTGNKFDLICMKPTEEKCFIAKQKFTNQVIGFIIFTSEFNDNENQTMGMIDALGVDRNFRRSTQPTGARNIGSSLLLIACNELMTVAGVNSIGVMMSDDEAGEFYKKYRFKQINDEDLVIEDLRITYPLIEHEFIVRSRHRITHSLNAKDDKYSPMQAQDTNLREYKTKLDELQRRATEEINYSDGFVRLQKIFEDAKEFVQGYEKQYAIDIEKKMMNEIANTIQMPYRNSLLFYAAGHPQSELMIKLLIKMGADINQANLDMTPLSATIFYLDDGSDTFNTFKELLKAGADPTLKDSTGTCALWFAISRMNRDDRFARHLRTLGFDINLEDPAFRELFRAHPSLKINYENFNEEKNPGFRSNRTL